MAGAWSDEMEGQLFSEEDLVRSRVRALGYSELEMKCETLVGVKPHKPKKEYFKPLFGIQDMGKRLRITLKNGSFVKQELFDYDEEDHSEVSWTQSKRSKKKAPAREELRVYQDSWPDEPSKKAEVKKKGKGKKGEEVPEKFPGTYYNPSDSTWYMFSEEKRRRPVEGRPFWHPTLRRVVQYEGGWFLDDTGVKIPELEGVSSKSGVSAAVAAGEPIMTLESLVHEEEFCDGD